jgi:prepilin-type N-terminal cleavage/methylation domain-containing protein
MRNRDEAMEIGREVRDGQGGFTLVEALIALVISGILATALISLLLGQSRFYERTDAQIYAEQSLRASMDLVSSELRMGSAADLLVAEPDSVVLRFDVLRAVVCDDAGSDAVALYALDRITDANLAGSFVGTAMSGPYEASFAFADGWTPSESSTGSGPKATCVAAGSPAGLPDEDYAVMTGWSSEFGVVPDPGSIVRIYGRLAYRFAPSTFFATRTALWRGTQELIGPLENGAAFSYVMDDGSVQASVSGSGLADVVAVRVTATTLGDGPNRYDVARPMEFDVPFRN